MHDLLVRRPGIKWILEFQSCKLIAPNLSSMLPGQAAVYSLELSEAAEQFSLHMLAAPFPLLAGPTYARQGIASLAAQGICASLYACSSWFELSADELLCNGPCSNSVKHTSHLFVWHVPSPDVHRISININVSVDHLTWKCPPQHGKQDTLTRT